MDERDRARVYDEVVDFFNDVYFNGPVEKQNRLVSSQNGREPVYFYSNDFRSRDIFGNTLLNRYMLFHINKNFLKIFTQLIMTTIC